MLRIVPLGGLGEIGLNAMLLEGERDAFLVDCGIMFPQAELLGVDIVVPDLSYVREIEHKLRGVVLTHGHEDHIGAVPWLLRGKPVPVFGTALTLGFVSGRLKEHGVEADLRVVSPGDPIDLGEFRVEGIRVTHSIPDAMGLCIDTPEGRVVHTGDFKIDHTPVGGLPTDLARFGQVGSEGVLCLLSDSTNSERPGVSLSEAEVALAFERIFARAGARVVIATFSSNLHRVQIILDLSRRFGRKVVLVGRSMQENVRIGMELGIVDIPTGLILDAEEGRKLRHEQVTVLATGAQGEPRSALMRMAAGDPGAPISIDEGDLVILSSRFIPGNEVAIGNMINLLSRRGADVLYESVEAIHTSGHAHQEEQKLMLRLVQPRHFVPVHGEYRHLFRHARTAQEVGLAERNTHVVTDGDVLQFESGRAWVNGNVPAGRIYVDRPGAPDVPEMTLRERTLMAETGLVTAVLVLDRATGAVVRGPELTARGLLASEETLADARREVLAAVDALAPQLRSDTATVQEEVRRAVRRAFKKITERRPVVLPVVIEL